MERKRVLTLFILGLFVTILIANFVAAQNIFDPVRDMFASWQEGELSINIAKYVVWILLLVIIYGILILVPPLDKLNAGLRFIVALLVSFLATAYLTPSDIYTVLASYGALGIVLSAVIPFVILLFFSIEVSRKGGGGGILLSKVVWFAFILFLFWKLIDGMYGISTGAQVINLTQGWVYIAFIILSIAWVFGVDRYIIKWVRRETTEDIKTRMEEATKLAAAREKAQARAARTVAEA